MANENFNKNHLVDVDYVNNAIIDAWEKMQVWMTENVDKLDYVDRIIKQLHVAYRGGDFDSAMEGADLITQAVADMTQALEKAGVIITEDDTLATYAQKITQVAYSGYEVCILGKSGTHYSAQQWNEYKEMHGEEPEADKVIAVISPYQSFVIGPKLNAQTPPTFDIFQWGNTTDNVSGLYDQQTGSFVNVLQNGLNFHSLENTYRMLLWYDPEVLPHTDYDPSDPNKVYDSYACIRFATKADLLASGIIMDPTQQVYVVTTDESDNNTSDNCYYWNGSAYAKRFQVPRVANAITGSPLAKAAWEYKAWDGDTRQYTVPTINHLLMMYVYQNDINACLDAVYHSTLPVGNSWSCQQNSANTACFVVVPSGSVTNVTKNNSFALVPIAAL